MAEKLNPEKLLADAKKMLDTHKQVKDLAKRIEDEKKKAAIRAKALDALPD